MEKEYAIRQHEHEREHADSISNILSQQIRLFVSQVSCI